MSIQSPPLLKPPAIGLLHPIAPFAVVSLSSRWGIKRTSLSVAIANAVGSDGASAEEWALFAKSQHLCTEDEAEPPFPAETFFTGPTAWASVVSVDGSALQIYIGLLVRPMPQGPSVLPTEPEVAHNARRQLLSILRTYARLRPWVNWTAELWAGRTSTGIGLRPGPSFVETLLKKPQSVSRLVVLVGAVLSAILGGEIRTWQAIPTAAVVGVALATTEWFFGRRSPVWSLDEGRKQ